MEFLLILSEDPAIVATGEDRAEAVRRTGEYAMGLLAKGQLKGGSPLAPVTEARKISARRGDVRVLDGPFAEGKEVIAGYFVVEVDSLEAAVELARDCPNVEFGSVEVRAIAHPDEPR
jgi:hypothetical protein